MTIPHKYTPPLERTHRVQFSCNPFSLALLFLAFGAGFVTAVYTVGMIVTSK